MTLEELIVENKKLKEENNRLKALLKKNNIPFENLNPVLLSTADKIAIYKSYFRGRNDVYAEQYISKAGKKGYAKTCINRFSNLCDLKQYKQCKGCPNEVFQVLDDITYKEHMKGEKSLGIYPIVEKIHCYFLAIDFDDEEFKIAAVAYKNECSKLGVDSIIELSQSGAGAHVWLFFEDKTSAKKARLLGDYLLSRAMLENKHISFKSYDRFFPSQDFVDEHGYGNCIALPLQGNCVKYDNASLFVDDCFVPYSNQIEALKNVKKISNIELDIIFKTNGISDASAELNIKDMKKMNLMKSDFANAVEIIVENDIYISKNGISNKALGYLKRLAVIYNPEFYEKQAKRMSTYKIERILILYKEDENWLALPRGCMDDLITLLNYVGVAYELKDHRVKLQDINVSFQAVLRDDQDQAVKELLKYESGLLIAPTGSGKTIMGMSVINDLHKPTLILVEKVKLLEQWKQRIKEFMNFDAGFYYNSKKKLTGIIDIASIKSLKEESDIYDKYELIIGDEIHHIASLTYETVIRRFKARHIYGFTATPNRSDHLEKIIYKCVSPIRSILEKKEESFEKILKPIFTKFKNKQEYELLSYPDLCKELYQNELRNAQIVKDIIKEYNNNKKIIVLTDRKNHIDILYDLLIEHCENIYKINGSSNTKEKIMFVNETKNLKERFIIISTGKYLGEGFDLPSLDTLFLTMPFKWKGLLSQYIGRIQRSYEGKHQVLVYDYVDIKCPKFSRQFQLRLKAYKKENYQIIDDNDKVNLLYSNNNYSSQLTQDIELAHNAKFMLNYYKKEQLNYLYALNDNITIVSDCEFDDNYNQIVKHSDLNIAVIDDKVMWYGSINPFAYSMKDDTILRIDDIEYIKEILNE